METLMKKQIRKSGNQWSHEYAISPSRYLAILLFILASSGLIRAQSNIKSVQEAFSKSLMTEMNGNYTESIATLKAVYDENSYEINLKLGWVNYLSGLFTESAAYYQKAIKLKPYAIEPKLGFVYPASALGNWDQVKAQYEEILKIDPQNTLVNYRMGQIFYGKNEFSIAEKYFEKVVNLYPFDYDSNIMYAWTEYKLGKFREAQVLFNKCMLIRPLDKSAQEGLGLIK
jgi:tetratricopeptide (TPR) repeat protein